MLKKKNNFQFIIKIVDVKNKKNYIKFGICCVIRIGLCVINMYGL